METQFKKMEDFTLNNSNNKHNNLEQDASIKHGDEITSKDAQMYNSEGK